MIYLFLSIKLFNEIISLAAHCFWDEVTGKPRAAENFKIGLGKFFRDWTAKTDYTQLRDVGKQFFYHIHIIP